MGFVLNRPMDLFLDDLLQHLNVEEIDKPSIFYPEIKVNKGGPVQNERGFVLHTPLGNWDSTMRVNNQLGVTASKDILIAIAKGQQPEKMRIMLGYSGWAAGQLEQELANNHWLTVPADEELLFDNSNNDYWQSAAGLIGVDMYSISTQAGHA